MILEAEAYSLAGQIGLFFPLLLMNSLVLSVNESVFSTLSFKQLMINIIAVAIAILLFFLSFSFLRELLSDFSILSSSVGFFFLSGFLFAAFNFLNQKKLIIHN